MADEAGFTPLSIFMSTRSDESSLTAPAEDSIRELVAFYEVIDQVSEDNKRIADWFVNYIGLVNEDDRKELVNVFTQTAAGLLKAVNHLEQVKRGEAPEPFEKITIELSRKELRDIYDSFILDVKHRGMLNRPALTSRAFLIAAESSFEVLFGKLAHVVYERHPSALGRSEYAFTLEQLSEFSSIDDARKALIDRRVDALLREGVSEWSKWLERTTNISLENMIDEWPVVREMFFRRNMLVHTDGKVTARYLADLRNAGIETSTLTIGRSLAPSVGYLKDMLQRLVALEALLVFHVSSKLYKEHLDSAARWIMGTLDFLVRYEMWTAGCLISRKFTSIKCRRDIQLAIQVNGWLAQKNRDGLDAIKHEVQSWDVTGLAPRYSVEKGLLLDKISNAMLLENLNNGVITQFEVATHPLFAEHRQILQPPAEDVQDQQLSADDTSD